MASPSACPALSADAPPFTPQPPHLIPTPASVFVGYVPPRPGLLPPPTALPPCPFMGALPPPISIGTNPFSALPPPPVFPCPVRGPPPPPWFVANPFPGVPPPLGLPCPIQGMTPPPSFPDPFLGPPPPPGSQVTAPPACGFTQGPGVGQPPFMPMPHNMVARPAAPRANTPPAGTWRAASGKARPKPMVPRQLRAAAKRAAALGVVTFGHDGHVAALAGEPSPRSVLVAATPTPPGSPPVLPAAFPYPAPTPESPPAPAGRAVATERSRRRSGNPAGAQPDQPRRPAKQAAGRGGRRSCQRPRRWFNPESSLTTLMIRNIPNAFTRQKMMNIIDQHCAEENETIARSGGIKSEYDFLYVPFDFKTQANKGYCFVNVTSPDAALRLWSHLHGFRWRVNDSGKTCEVDYADIQGREKLVSHFSMSWFDCHSEELLPVWFSPARDGSRPAVVERHVVGQLGRRI